MVRHDLFRLACIEPSEKHSRASSWPHSCKQCSSTPSSGAKFEPNVGCSPMHSHCVLRGATPKSSKILSSHRQATGGSESIDGWQCFERQDKCTRMLAWVDQKDLVMLPGGIGQMEKNWNFIRMSKMDEGAYEMIVEYHIEPHLVRHNIEHFLISFCH